MGCDGGTIPRRDELVKVKKKPEAKDKDSELSFQWRHCSITQQVLQKPIVMCGLGRLYNKVALIEALLNRDTMPPSAKHIKSLKDIKDLNLTLNPAYKNDDKKNGGTDSRGAPYICPVIGLEMSGKFRFVGIWSCGCVFSERALKEIATKNCHKCQKPFEENDVVILNGNEDDVVLMKQRMELRQQKQKKKRERNKVKVEVAEATCTSTSAEKASITNEDVSKVTKEPAVVVPIKAEGNSKVTKASVSKTSIKVDTKVANKLLKLVKRPGSLTAPTTDAKKMKPDYSVAKDPQVTDVYKSIFTTHASEKQQNRAHWVTYNPFYN